MIEVNAIVAVVGLLLILVGPMSGIWSGLKINSVTQRLDVLVKSWDENRANDRDWLKDLEEEAKELREKTEENSGSIKEVIAIMRERDKRE